jgi:hypothetical protein
MEYEIIGAYVAGSFSLLVAIYAANKAAHAESFAKIRDQVRSKALSAVEDITSSLGRVLLATEAQRKVIERGGMKSSEEFVAFCLSVQGNSVDKFIEAHYRTRVYWSANLSKNLDSLVYLLTNMEEKVEYFQKRELFISSTISDLVSYSQDKFLWELKG